jgi:hypothetical protein
MVAIFLRVCSHLGRYMRLMAAMADASGSPAALLLGIATEMALQRLRKRVST